MVYTVWHTDSHNNFQTEVFQDKQEAINTLSSMIGKYDRCGIIDSVFHPKTVKSRPVMVSRCSACGSLINSIDNAVACGRCGGGVMWDAPAAT